MANISITDDLNGATPEEVKEIDEFFTELGNAEERKSRWTEARTGGVPSEIKLQEVNLAEATRALDELEVRLSNMRGDSFPMPPLVPTALQSTTTTQTAPAPSVVQAPGQSMSMGNSTKQPRNDILSPVIKLAQSKAADAHDTSAVWAQIQALADEEHPPLLASTKEGVKYKLNGETRYFTRDALYKRLHPEKRGKPRKRR